MKNNLLRKVQKHHSVLLLCTAMALGMSLSACNNDDDSPEPPVPANDPFAAAIVEDMGAQLTFTYQGGNVVESSGSLFGWNGGQLLNGNYFRSFSLNTNQGGFIFRLNVPSHIQWSGVAPGSHELTPWLIPLQETAFLDEVSAELYNPSGLSALTAVTGPASGTVTIERDRMVLGVPYSITGTVRANFLNEGNPVYMEGLFWSKTFSW